MIWNSKSGWNRIVFWSVKPSLTSLFSSERCDSFVSNRKYLYLLTILSWVTVYIRTTQQLKTELDGNQQCIYNCHRRIKRKWHFCYRKNIKSQPDSRISKEHIQLMVRWNSKNHKANIRLTLPRDCFKGLEPLLRIRLKFRKKKSVRLQSFLNTATNT